MSKTGSILIAQDSMIHTKESTLWSGFTLIELLVVVAVISVLLAISMPVLSTVRTLAKRTQCASQMRQIGMAWQMYLTDNEAHFPQKLDMHLWFGGWKGELGELQMWWGWPRPLNPYAQLGPNIDATSIEAKVFCCPADRGGSPDDDTLKVFMVNGNSYCTNLLLVGQDQIGDGSPGIDELHDCVNARLKNMSVSKVTNNPARIVLFGDYGWLHEWDYDESAVDLDDLNWHRKAHYYNIAFLDGHIEFLRVENQLYFNEDYTILPFKECNELGP